MFLDEDDDYDCDPGDYPSMESEMSVPSPESSLSPRPSSLAESMQVTLESRLILSTQPGVKINSFNEGGVAAPRVLEGFKV